MNPKLIVVLALAISATAAAPTAPGSSPSDMPYLLELCFVALVVLLVYFYFQGRQKNSAILNTYLAGNFPLFARNFSYVGMSLIPTESLPLEVNASSLSGDIVEQDTPNFYRMYFTGRANLKFGIVNLSLQRRQDLIMSTVYSLFWPEKDRVFIELAFEDLAAPKGIFYLLRTKNVKKCLQDFDDLKTLCRKYRADSIAAPNLAIYAENDEIVEFLCDKAFSETVNKYWEIIESVELSDCITSELHKGLNVKICIGLGKGSAEDCERVLAVSRAFFQLVDRIAVYSPSKRLTEELEQSRRSFNSRKEKERKQQSGDTKGSREERIAKMTPAERRKFEEKEEKRQKSKQGKMFKVVKK